MQFADVLAGELKQEAATTARLLERVPSDKLEWRPHAKSSSLGDLAYHIGALLSLAKTVLQQSDLDVSAPRPKTPRDVPPADLYRRNLDDFLSLIGSMDNDQMMQPFHFHFGDKTIMNAPKAAMIRTLLLNHTYHHRGQLSVYLRLLDVPLPSIYGPTADENAF